MKRILIGGSPCTHWSIAQKNNRETEPDGIGWELFKNYLIAKEKFKPDFFLYENNKSAAQPIKDQISKELGVPLQYINSALVSAQNRQRFYAHNIPNVPQPEDRGILLRDILESGIVDREKAHCLKHQAGNSRDYFKKHHTQIAFEPVPINTCEDGKSRTIKAQYFKNGIANFVTNGAHNATCVAEPVCVAQRGIYESTGNRSVKVEGDKIVQVYEAREDGKTNALTTVQKDNAIAEPVRIGDLPNEKGEISGSQATRIYSVDGKSVNLVANGGGQGAKTGLYAVPYEYVDYIPRKNSHIVINENAIRCSQDKNNASVAESFVNFTDRKIGTITTAHIPKCIESVALHPKAHPVYEVRNGYITIKDKQYPIKLADGFYIIRKLTVTECCRLQTLPDNYCRAVSASQGYKGLGNGWTAEVIIHILKHMNIPLDEEIEILSMYDGIGTGRYCFDKMGYKNIKYYAYEIDKYPIQVAMSNYDDIIQCGDAFQVRNDDWRLI